MLLLLLFFLLSTKEAKSKSKSKGRLKMFIYALCDPVNGKLRYIGITKLDPVERLNTHWSKRNHEVYMRIPVYGWLHSLSSKPVVAVLAVTEDDSLEDRFIQHFGAQGHSLLNARAGRNGTESLRTKF